MAECGPDELWRGLVHLALGEYRDQVGRITAVKGRLDELSAATGTRLLRTIPGVGPRTAEAVSAYLGDASRLATAKKVGAYAGLVPTQYQSGVTDRRGWISYR